MVTASSAPYATMHLHRVDDVREWLDVAHAIVEKYAEDFSGVSVM